MDACTLPTAQQPLRAREFDGLFRNHPAELQTAPGRAVLMFRGDDDLALLVRDLADRESACCSFFRFEVTAENGAVRLTVEVPAERQDVLDALVVSTRSLLDHRRSASRPSPSGTPRTAPRT